MTQYQSHAGYFGAISVIVLTFLVAFLKHLEIITNISNSTVFLIIAISFIVMVISEYFLKRNYNQKVGYTVEYKALRDSNLYIFKSTIIRFLALFIPFLFFYFIIQHHKYFLDNSLFEPTREFFDYLLYIFIFLSIPYIFLTLKFRGDSRYEFGDYAILTIVAIKSLFKLLFCENYNHKFHKNRRIKKVWLLYLVNFFFLTLMARFVVSEFNGFQNEASKLYTPSYYALNWYGEFKNWFLVIFHLIFTIDVTIATIGYTFASRWLGNRTKSVDATLSGWMVALMCYPPFNSVSSQFIGYNGLDTHQLITDEHILAVVLVTIILLYSLYVWATIALGFKFSNLTNRGIVDIGPYKYVRHPAYVSKNLSWWVDNTFVLTNIWASIAMAMWNVVYITRGLTEERHLNHDKKYREYCQKVKYRFIPKVI